MKGTALVVTRHDSPALICFHLLPEFLSNLLAHTDTTKMAACFRSIASLTHSPRDLSRSGTVSSLLSLPLSFGILFRVAC
ncbi:hypothetical protein AALP_AA7G129900 [Arabis alpina]|uniref:Uncharacterized protein n=1 Tax=Arabis alpina TaxID=50452 RepID=A0A087GHQ4_ARAAL|nr:hypothetical protein AALP_AA7G129900 [Arabis alpina]